MGRSIILSLLDRDPRLAVFYAFLCMMALTVHEFFHAWAAHKCGDDTALLAGRMTLNPLAHLDLVGSIMILLVGFGWAKPVPVMPLNFKNPRRDEIVISALGPVSNLGLAVILALVVRVLLWHARGGDDPQQAGGIYDAAIFLANFGVWLNVALALFNLLPVFALAGLHIAENLAPPRIAEALRASRPFGIIMLIVLMMSVGWIVIGVPTAIITKMLCGL